MGARLGRWDLLGLVSDPVPASQADVTEHAHAAQARADSLSTLAGQLQRLSVVAEWTGEAADAFQDEANDEHGRITKAEQRYADLAKALRTWSFDIDDARVATAKALDHAVSAHATLTNLNNHPPQQSSDPTPAEQQATKDHEKAVQHAHDDASSAVSELNAAMLALDGAATTAANAINSAADKEHDHWWDDAGGWIRAHADLIEKICQVLEDIAMVVAAITIIVLILAATIFSGGTALAAILPFLMWASVGLAAGVLACHAALKASGDKSITWGQIAWDVAGLVLAFVGTGVGKVAEKAVAGTASKGADALGDAAKLAGRKTASGGFTTQAESAGNILDPKNNLWLWSQKVEQAGQAARTNVMTAFDDGLKTVKATPRTWSGIDRTTMVATDSETATNFAKIHYITNAVGPAMNASIQAAIDSAKALTKSQLAVGLGSKAHDIIDICNTIKGHVAGGAGWFGTPAR